MTETFYIFTLSPLLITEIYFQDLTLHFQKDWGRFESAIFCGIKNF